MKILTTFQTILETCDIWDTDYNSDNWELEFMTIIVSWQLRVTGDSIRNSCDVFFALKNLFLFLLWKVTKLTKGKERVKGTLPLENGFLWRKKWEEEWEEPVQKCQSSSATNVAAHIRTGCGEETEKEKRNFEQN